MEKELSARMTEFQDRSAPIRTSKDPYEFLTLRTSTTIRLIKICREKVQDCIACEIYHFDEEEQRTVQYQALSYVWGDPQSTRQIFLRGPGGEWHPFPLHENLWQFLDHAWRQEKFGQLFWTDRLCLDQVDHEEISQQVPRMRAIYQGADSVLIWLQLKEEEERCLLKLLRCYERFTLGWPRTEALRRKMQERIKYDQDYLLSLIKNPYWSRVWIVQEVVVPRKVCVACRDVLIPLEMLPLSFNKLRLSIRFKTFDLPFRDLLDMREAHGKLPLWKILIGLSDYQSSRPADRVYGLLGLVEDNEDGSSPTDYIQVNYDKPTPHVFLDAIFESSPSDLDVCIRLPQCLGDWSTYNSCSLLEGYITHSRTMPRHKTLAKLALQTLQAIKIIKSVPGAPPEGDLVVFRRESSVDVDARAWWRPILEQHAGIIGLALARSSSVLSHDWRAHRRIRGEASSPWRCAAHTSVDTTSTGMLSYGPMIAGTWPTTWALEGVVEACGERSQSCDVSIMTCDLPQVGLRFLLSFLGHERSSIFSAQASVNVFARHTLKSRAAWTRRQRDEH